MNNDKTDNKIRNRIIIIVIISIIFIGGAIIWPLIRNQLYPAKLELEFTPRSSIATINGKKVKAGIIYVRPGELEVTVSKEGFGTKTKTVTAKKDQTVYLGIALLSTDESTKDWYIKDRKDGVLLEKILGQNYDNAADTAVKKTPLISKLPYIGPGEEYRIDYGNPPKNSSNDYVTIIITFYVPIGKEEALKWIGRQGYDPTKLKIIYYDQTPGGIEQLNSIGD